MTTVVTAMRRMNSAALPRSWKTSAEEDAPKHVVVEKL
jgi:hypothetical protein